MVFRFVARNAALGCLAAVTLVACGGLRSEVVVPDHLRATVREAGTRCKGINARVIAAQIQQESGWDRLAESPSGAQGIAQFMPPTWAAWGRDLDGDGTADPFDAEEAIDAQARLMCFLWDEADRSGLAGDPVRLALAGYNAGWGPVQTYGGIPPYPETREYVSVILDLAERVRFR